MVKRTVVGAHYGLRDWAVQRVTAGIVAVYSVFLLATLIAQPALDFITWRGLFQHTWMRVPTFVCLLAVYVHAWIGVRDILMDYIKHDGLRLALQVVTVLLLAGYVGWAIEILWR